MLKNIFLIVIAITCLATIQAQNGKPLANPHEKPVLINNLHPQSLQDAAEVLSDKQLSALTVIPNLTTKQKKCISKIETCRDKKLSKVRTEIDKLKTELLTLKTENNNLRKIAKTEEELSKLIVDYRNIARKAKTKVESTLTEQQKKLYLCIPNKNNNYK